MSRIKVNWGKLDALGKRTMENKNTFETSRSRLQELVDELMNYWKGQDAENYHEKATTFLDYLKGETEFMDEWGKYFSKASGNYKSGVEEGLKNIKQTNALIGEVVANPKSILIEDKSLDLSSEFVVGEAFSMEDPDDAPRVYSPTGEIKPFEDTTHVKTGPIDEIPENHGPFKSGPIDEIPENHGPFSDAPISEMPVSTGEVRTDGHLVGVSGPGGSTTSNNSEHLDGFTGNGGN